MKVRTRTLLILSAALVVFLIVLALITQSVILQAFGEIEGRETTAHVQRFVSQLDSEIEDVAATTRDWSLRQETSELLSGPGREEDTAQLFPPGIMKNLGIDYILLYDAGGNRILSGTITEDGEIASTLPPGLDMTVSNSIMPEDMQGGIAGRRGLSTIKDTPVILAGYPVQYGPETDPLQGTLVMARALDSGRIDDINRMLQTDGTLVSYSMGTDPAILSAEEAVTAKEGGIIVRQSGDNRLDGYALITGIENHPTFLLLTIGSPRPVYQMVKNSILIVAGVIVLLSVLYLLVVQHLLQRFVLFPLSRLDSGMKSISRSGDLTLRMPEIGDDEVVSLVRSHNRMLETIQSQQEEMQALLEEIGQQRDDLNDARGELADRNRELEELNRKANLYLDIYLDVITYEILNAIMGLRGYADLVKSTADEAGQKFAGKIIDLANRSNDVIRNIETISRIYKNPPEAGVVDLAAVIKTEMGRRTGARIVMDNCNRNVCADDMLGVVFDNIFANSLKFGGRDTTIRVTARDIPEEMIEVSVTDTGPGIPDAVKPLIFDRFSADSRTRSSYGLGLHIVKMLIESYGGSVRADDHIPGSPQSGAAIRFTLRIAKE
ncbi:ATP-binding protein [Methanoregula sp.]|uniref:sensor histidine kinase n=1 Tax=Methanoregula sp. TaxID=2052170 RepID=UPI0025F68DEF|nr:ATP-binding protein [Methanoregula sp.]